MRGNTQYSGWMAARRRTMQGAVVLSALLAAACTPHVSNWSPSNAPKENKVSWVNFNHMIDFAPGQAVLTQRSRQGIVRFLRDHSVRQSDRVFVGSTGRLVDDRAADLAERRSAAVTEFLRRNRVFARPLPDTPSQAAWDGSVTLLIGRYVVTSPKCPDWTKPATGDPSNRVSSNFGCATTTNLGLMVADPGDLLRGAPGGPADAEAASGAIQRFRAGKVKTQTPLDKRPDTTSGSN